MITKFPANIHKELSNYIYALYDPREDLPFYIGRGVRDRVFSHIKGSHNEKVREKIDYLQNQGLKPIIKILIHGLTNQQARAAETAAIAILGKDNLANEMKGAGSSLTNVSPAEIVHHYNAKEVLINHKAILIVRNPWNPNQTEQYHYDLTRASWKVGQKKNHAEYAFLIHQSVVKRIYSIAAWYPDGTTFHTRNNPDPNNPHYRHDYKIRDRYEFVGKLLDQDDPLINKYVGKSVKRYLRASGSAIHYSYNAQGEMYKFDKINKVINP
jgi:hypothetical protein|tara:strand:+ start:4486 stop:5292 length:807 start_codon:yes stop_codon:yes gene_type:complete